MLFRSRFVIVYGWQRTLDRGQGKTPVRRPTAVGLTRKGGGTVRGFSLPWGPLQIVSPGYAEAVELDRQYDREEGSRMAYVAATRALDRLVLLSHNTGELVDGILQDAAAALLQENQPGVALFDEALTVRLARPAAPTAQAGPAERPVRNPATHARIWSRRMAESATLAEMRLVHRPSQP